MKLLLRTIRWDLRFLVRYNILTIAIVIAVIYAGIFLLFNLRGNDDILIAVIFSDPTFMGFVFIGVLVLFEKGSNTLQALVVTPVKVWQYLFSKAIALTLVTMIICFAIIFAGHGFRFNYLMFIMATFLSSILFVFLGFIGVAKVKTFNQYIIVIPLFLMPLSLPYLGLFNVTDAFWLYLIPTNASFILFEATFESVPVTTLIYAFLYLGISIGVTYLISKRLFVKHIIENR
ncbi:MAG: ABC transporter permease [Prolixibacteraceae bacterium]|nr:ABC transporter permease [Prolixibacteraceae bacterium]MBN2775869.1 ABC transporter permease [Prolixibacteraceae bacterium]